MSAVVEPGPGNGKAIILLSGGLDSATVLALAASAGRSCFALSVDYGQLQREELSAARQQAEIWQVHEFRCLTLDLRGLCRSALTDSSIPIPSKETEGIPETYVPARNTILLSLAAGWAETVGAGEIYIGVNALDYSGYPDCRGEFIRAFEQLLACSTKAGIEGEGPAVRAPLLHSRKSEIITAGLRLGVNYAATISCYRAEQPACGHCDSCRLRLSAFAELGLDDPLPYRR